MKYWVEGKIFDTELKAKEYEKEIKRKNEEKEQFEAIKHARWNKVLEARENWIKLYGDYVNDYVSLNDFSKSIDDYAKVNNSNTGIYHTTKVQSWI